ncbi:hypothetical protein Barb6_02347 [Bacteroidales bacterium Barb6]|nr:hypothetical protein Barb6_02347 [Bacteroidales bacterium Barb6]
MGTDNSTPKITVNKLAEFLTATPSRQRKILEMIKYPKENVFAASAYKESREAIKSYFKNGFNEDTVSECLSLLESKRPAKNDYQESMLNSQIEALEAVLDSGFSDDSFEYEKYTGRSEPLVIAGVEISVNPDLSVRLNKKAGILKIHISKSGKLEIKAGSMSLPCCITTHQIASLYRTDLLLATPAAFLTMSSPTSPLNARPPSKESLEKSKPDARGRMHRKYGNNLCPA